jgi:precorrin-4 methylase
MSIVHFIGAGPGDPELITVRGKRLIEEAPVVLYAGSLVPPTVVAMARADALVIDTAPLTLDEIVVARQSRGSIPAIPRSMARPRSRCGAWTSSASTTT